MTFEELPIAARRAVCLAATMDALGFRDETSVEIGVYNDATVIDVLLARTDKKPLRFRVGHIEQSWADAGGWESVAGIWQTIDGDERLHHWESLIGQQVMEQVLARLAVDGINVPIAKRRGLPS